MIHGFRVSAIALGCPIRHNMGFVFNETFPHSQHTEKGNSIFKFIRISILKFDLQTQKGH